MKKKLSMEAKLDIIRNDILTTTLSRKAQEVAIQGKKLHAGQKAAMVVEVGDLYRYMITVEKLRDEEL